MDLECVVGITILSSRMSIQSESKAPDENTYYGECNNRIDRTGISCFTKENTILNNYENLILFSLTKKIGEMNMNKRVSGIVIASVLVMSLSACGSNQKMSTSEIAIEDKTSETTKVEDTIVEEITSIMIRHEDDNTAIIIESDLVKRFAEIVKADKDAEFLVEFEGDEEEEMPKKGFSLLFEMQNGEEPSALYINSVTNQGYSSHEEDILSFTIEDDKTTWSLNGMELPLDGVETVSIWIVSGDHEPMEHFDMSIADVKMETKVDAVDNKDSNDSVAVDEPMKLDYQGIYHSTGYTGKEYEIVVDENTLTVNDRYTTNFTKDNVTATYWKGTVTDTMTGEKVEEVDFQLQQLPEDGQDQMFLSISFWFGEEQFLIEYAKRD